MNDGDIHEQVKKLLNNAAPADMGVQGRTSRDEEIARRLDALAAEQGFINSLLADQEARIKELEAAEAQRLRLIEDVLRQPAQELRGWRKWIYWLFGF